MLRLFFVLVDVFEMVCPKNDSILNISIPVVMVTKSTGDSLKSMASSGKGEILSDMFLFSFHIFIHLCTTLSYVI